MKFSEVGKELKAFGGLQGELFKFTAVEPNAGQRL